MNTEVKKDSAISLRAVMLASAKIEEANAAVIDAIRTEANRVTDAKAEKAGIDDDKAGLWGHLRSLVLAIDEATEGESGKFARACLSIVLEAALEGEAVKTAASYAATAGKALEGLKAGKLAAATFPESYSDLREAMKSDAKKAIDAKAKDIAKLIGKIKKHKVPGKALDALKAIEEAVNVFALEADASREESKRNAKAAKELAANRQQQPSEPMQTEVSKAA